MADLFYAFGFVAYTAISAYAVWYLYRALFVIKRTSAAAVALLGNIGQKLDTIQADVTSIKGRVERLEHAAAAYQAGIAAVSAEAAE